MIQVWKLLAHGVGERGDFFVQAADAADQGDQRGQFLFGRGAIVAVELAVGLPDAQRGEFGFVGFELVEHLAHQFQRDFAPPPGLGEEDGQGFDFVTVGGQPVGEFAGQAGGLAALSLLQPA
jgi:hypothetical protein